MIEGLVSAVDLGGTKVRAVVADWDGQILARGEEYTTPEGGALVTSQIIDLVGSLLVQAGHRNPSLEVLVIGVPGVIREDGHGVDPRWVFNIRDFLDLDLVDMVASALDVRVILENDLNLAAWGEWTVGNGRNTDPFAFVGLGTGIGMGLVVAGNLIRGAHRYAGEIAHLPLGDLPSPTGIVAVSPWLELQVNQEALLSAVSNADHRKVGIEPRTAADVYLAAEEGDERALAAITDQAWSIAKAIATISLVLDPELVVIGGGMGLQDSLTTRVRAKLALLHPNPPDLASSSLRDDAGLIGGIQYALHRKRAVIQRGGRDANGAER